MARSIEAHLSATDEVRLLAALGTGRRDRQQVRAVIAEHEDIVAVLREAGLQPPGSPSWWRLADEAMSLWAQLTEREAPAVLTELALRADEALRHRLGLQWRASWPPGTRTGACPPADIVTCPGERHCPPVARTGMVWVLTACSLSCCPAQLAADLPGPRACRWIAARMGKLVQPGLP